MTTFDSKDNSLLQVDVRVLDVNDNPPRFVSRVFTGGVTTEANFGTTFMKVLVSSGRVRFSHAQDWTLRTRIVFTGMETRRKYSRSIDHFPDI